MTIEGPDNGFTPKQLEQLDELIKHHHLDAKSTKVERADRPPTWGKYLGKIDEWVAYLKNHMITGIITIILIPANVDRAYHWYAPKAEIAFDQVSEIWKDFESGLSDPENSPPNDSYIAWSAPYATTMTPPPNSDIDGIGIISASGVPPENLGRYFTQISPPSGEPPRDMFT